MAPPPAKGKGGKGAPKAGPVGKRGLYKVEGGKIVRTRKQCPKCGPGTFLAQHKNRTSCGKCAYTEQAAPKAA